MKVRTRQSIKESLVLVFAVAIGALILWVLHAGLGL